MLILAAEQSTADSSAVISDNSEILAKVSWHESRLRSQQFFPKISSLLAQLDRKLEDIDVFAAGTGPGAFSALRMCISAMKAFSLPSARKVYAVSSAQALALEIRSETGKNRISIIGDARRGHLWVANCSFDNSPVPDKYEIFLTPPAQLAETVADAEVIASPDFQRIPEILGALPEASDRLIRGARCPDARFVAETAFAALTQSIPSPDFKPTYLHPAVQSQ